MKRLALIMAIVIIGLGGYFAWQHSQDKKNSSKTPSTATQRQSTTPNTSAHKKDDPSEGGKFLVIKEWGVRLPYPDSARDVGLQYSLDTENQSQGLTSIGFDAISEKLKGCLSLRIWREPTSGPRPNTNSDKVELKGPITLGGYYYTWNTGLTACDTSSSQRTKEAETILNELAGSISKLEAVE